MNYIKELQKLQEARKSYDESLKTAERHKEEARRQLEPKQQSSAPRSNARSGGSTMESKLLSTAMSAPQAEQEFLQEQGVNPQETNDAISAHVDKALEENPREAEEVGQAIHPNVSNKLANSGVSVQEFEGIQNLESQGVNEENAYNAIVNGADVNQNASLWQTTKNAGKVAMGSLAESIGAISALIPRMQEAAFGKDSLADWEKTWLDNSNEMTDNCANYIERAKNEGQDISIVHDKNTGEVSVKNNGQGLSGTAQKFALGTAEFLPDLALTPLGGVGAITFGAKGASNSLRESELTEKEDNDLLDLAQAVVVGVANGTLFKYTPKIGEKAGMALDGRLTSAFSKLCKKFGASATKRMLASDVASLLAKESGGLVGGETFMVGSTALNDLTNMGKDAVQGTNNHETDLWKDICDSAREGVYWHLAGKVQHAIEHPINSVKSIASTPFKINGRMQSYKQAEKSVKNALIDNDCLYNGENKVKTATYNGKQYFVRKEGNGKATLVDKETYEPVEISTVDSKYKPSNAGVKKLDTYVGDFLGERIKPTIPNVYRSSDNKLVWVKNNGKLEEVGSVKATDDGRLFMTRDANGKPQVSIYNGDAGELQTLDKYLYSKARNRVEEADIIEGEPVENKEAETTEPTNVEDAQIVDETKDATPIQQGVDDILNTYTDENGEYNVLVTDDATYLLPKEYSTDGSNVDVKRVEYDKDGKGLLVDDTITLDGSEEVGKNSLDSVNELLGRYSNEEGNNGDTNNSTSDNSGSDNTSIVSDNTNAEVVQQPASSEQQATPLVNPKNYAIDFSKGATSKDIVTEIENVIGDGNPKKLEFASKMIDKQLKAAEQAEDAEAYNALVDVQTELENRIAKAKADSKIAEAQAKEEQKTAIDNIKNKAKQQRAKVVTNTLKAETEKNNAEIANTRSKKTLERVKAKGKNKQASTVATTANIEENRNEGTEGGGKEIVVETTKQIRKEKENNSQVVEDDADNQVLQELWADYSKEDLQAHDPKEDLSKVESIYNSWKDAPNLSENDKEIISRLEDEIERLKSKIAEQQTKTTNVEETPAVEQQAPAKDGSLTPSQILDFAIAELENETDPIKIKSTIQQATKQVRNSSLPNAEKRALYKKANEFLNSKKSPTYAEVIGVKNPKAKKSKKEEEDKPTPPDNNGGGEPVAPTEKPKSKLLDDEYTAEAKQNENSMDYWQNKLISNTVYEVRDLLDNSEFITEENRKKVEDLISARIADEEKSKIDFENNKLEEAKAIDEARYNEKPITKKFAENTDNEIKSDIANCKTDADIAVVSSKINDNDIPAQKVMAIEWRKMLADKKAELSSTKKEEPKKQPKETSKTKEEKPKAEPKKEEKKDDWRTREFSKGETFKEHLEKLTENSTAVSKLKAKLSEEEQKEVDEEVVKIRKANGIKPKKSADEYIGSKEINDKSLEEKIKETKDYIKSKEDEGYDMSEYKSKVAELEKEYEINKSAHDRYAKEHKDSKDPKADFENDVRAKVSHSLKIDREGGAVGESKDDKSSFKKIIDNAAKIYGSTGKSLNDAIYDASLIYKSKGVGEFRLLHTEKGIRDFCEAMGKTEEETLKAIADNKVNIDAYAKKVRAEIQKKSAAKQAKAEAKDKEKKNVNEVKHPLTEKALATLKKALDGTGLFNKVQFISNEGILKRYAMDAGEKSAQTIRDSNGILLGFLSKGGDIFLNKDYMDADTAVHEIAHTLFKAYDNNGLVTEKFWQDAEALADASGAIKELPSVYDNLSHREKTEEALVRAIGERGGIKLQGSLWERFKDMANHKWQEILSFFGSDKAKANLKFSEIAEQYAESITSGNFTENERKALEDTRVDVEKCVDGMADEFKEINGTKLAVSQNSSVKKGIWEKQNWLDRATGHYFKFMNVQGLGIGKETWREKISRYVFDTLDPVYRMEVEAHKIGAYIDDNADYVEAAAVSQSVIRSMSEKFTNSQVLNFETCVNDIYDIFKGKTIVDKYGNETISVEDKDTLKELISDYLIAKNASNGRNDRTYKEIVEAVIEKSFGIEKKKIEASAREAKFTIKNAKRAIDGLNNTIKNLEDKIANASPADKANVKADAEIKLRKALADKKAILEMARKKANYIKQAMKQKAKTEWEEEQDRLHPTDPQNKQPFVPTADMQDFGSFHLTDRDINGLDYNGLKQKAKDIENYTNTINDYIIFKKEAEKLVKAKEKLEQEIEDDKKKMPQTEWLHKVWEPAHPNEAPIYGDENGGYGVALQKAINAGVVQKYKTDGCGITNDMARDFCDRFESIVGDKLCDQLSQRTKAITNFAIDNAKEGGLISETEYNEMKDRNEKEYYVPMRSFKYDPKDAENDYASMLIHDGTGADRSLVTKANGRTSESGNAYKSMLNLAYSSISASRTNKDVMNYYKFLSDVFAQRGKQAGRINDKKLEAFKNLVSIGKWRKRMAGTKDRWEESKDAPDLDNPTFDPTTGNIVENGYEYMFEGGNIKNFARGNNENETKAKAHAVNVYVDGKKLTMMFSEARVAQAFNKTNQRLNSMQQNIYLDMCRKLTAMQSKWITSYCAKFAFANHERDLGTYVLRLAGSGYKNTYKNIGRSYSDIFQFIMLGKDPRITINGKTYSIGELLNDNGLATGYIENNKQSGVEGLRADIDKFRTKEVSYKKDASGRYTKEINKTLSDRYDDIAKSLTQLANKKTPQELQTAVRMTFEAFGKAVEVGKIAPEQVAKMAEWLELVPRYAAFRTAIDNGATFEQAIRFGKNITTNFNRSGDLKYHHLGQYLYAHTPFFNAAMQGIKMAHDMTQAQTKRTVSLMMGMLAVGLVTDELERLWFGENGIGKDKSTDIDDYNRGSSLRVKIDEDHYLPIFMPHFFRMPLDAAMNINDFVHGERSGRDAIFGLFGSFADVTHWDFSKLNQGADGVIDIAEQTLAPGWARPIMDVWRNRNFFGSNIYKEPFDDSDIAPEWQNTFGNSTLPIFMDASQMLNRLGGGTDDIGSGYAYTDGNGVVKPNIQSNNKGWLDINPQAAQYIVTNIFPALQYVGAGYRAYAKAEEKNGDATLSVKQVLSLIPKSMQLDKDFYREFPDEEITASKMVYEAKKYLNVIKAIKDNPDIAKTPEQRAEIRAWENTKALTSQIRKLKTQARKADERGNVKLAKKLSDKMKEKNVALAAYLYQLETERDLHDKQKALKDRWERITKQK